MTGSAKDADHRELIDDNAATELSSNRTSLSFERTRMSADRTLMSIVRTSLSLIGFGFTIHEVFAKGNEFFPRPDLTGRTFGLSLLVLGVALLVMGIVSHAMYSHALEQRRERLYGLQLLRRMVRYGATPTYVTAVLLLLIGLLALIHAAFRLF